MRREVTPIENRGLIATKNCLSFNPATSTYVSVDNPNIQYTGSSQTWGFSMLFCVRSFNTGDIADLISRRQNPIPQSDGAGFLLRAIKVVGGYTLSFQIEGNGSLPLVKDLDTFRLNNWYRVSLTCEAFDGSNVYINYKINDRQIIRSVLHNAAFTVTSPQPLIIGGAFYPGYNLIPDAFIGNVIFWNHSPADNELSYLHKNNIFPASFHSRITGHYPLNQNVGVKAWDVVEQYNYAKGLPVAAKHGDLINYTNEEAGVSNPLIQVAWNDFYSKRKNNNNYLRLDGAGQYLTLPSFSNQTINQWTMMFVLETKGLLTGPQAFFGNKLVNPSLYFRFNVVAEQVEIFLGSGGTNRLSTLSYSPGHPLKFLIWTDGVNSRLYPEGGSYQNGHNYSVPESAFTQNDFVNFFFGYNHFFGNTYGGGLGRLIMLDKAADLRERKTLFNADQSDLYKGFSRILDIDFSDVFLNSGKYYARDNSGHNRHAQLNTFSPSSNQPLRTDQSTRLPERIKALKLNGINQYLSIDGFNPTKENGYTYIIGMCLNGNRNFDSGYGDCFISKRDSSNGKLKIIYGDAGTKTIRFISTAVGFFGGDMVVMNTDTSKPHFITISEKTSLGLPKNGKAYIDGNITRIEDNGNDDPQDFNEIDGELCIGRDDDVARYLNGYLFFVGIWKGFLTDDQVGNISNNSLGANVNPSLMNDCQLYLNFEEIINDAGVYKINDWSPQNRIVILRNYTTNEINPAHADYKLVNLDSLR